MRTLAKFFYPDVFTQVESLNRMLADCEAQLEEKRTVVIHAGSELIKNQDEIKSLTAQVESAKKMYEQLQSSYDGLVESFNTLRYEYDRLEQDYQDELSLDETGTKLKYEKIMEDSDEPWCIFEIRSFEQEGIKINFNWNRQFINQIRKLGFDGESEEENVQSFFTLVKMMPPSFINAPENDIS